MNKIALSLILGISLILGSVSAMAETTNKEPEKGIQTMSAPSARNADGSKGLKEPLIVPNGQESWVLHQPMERYPVYFNSTGDSQANRQSAREENRQNS